jgi:hypothetical protein
MAILQGIISLLTRSVGKIFSALLDWAVVALFGRVEGRQKIWLSALMEAAAVWPVPVLLLGVAAPKVAVSSREPSATSPSSSSARSASGRPSSRGPAPTVTAPGTDTCPPGSW